MQALVPKEMLGHVSSLVYLFAFALGPLGILAGGAAAAEIGTRTALVLSGAVSGGICLAVIFIPGVRDPQQMAHNSSDAAGRTRGRARQLRRRVEPADRRGLQRSVSCRDVHRTARPRGKGEKGTPGARKGRGEASGGALGWALRGESAFVDDPDGPRYCRDPSHPALSGGQRPTSAPAATRRSFRAPGTSSSCLCRIPPAGAIGTRPVGNTGPEGARRGARGRPGAESTAARPGGFSRPRLSAVPPRSRLCR